MNRTGTSHLRDVIGEPSAGKTKTAVAIHPEAAVSQSGYDREWTTRRDLPAGTRIRLAYTADTGTPVRFLVQLEFRHEGSWRQVARFDHDGDGPRYRDVERVGLHLDRYGPDGTQREKVTDFPPAPPGEAMDFAERYLRRRAKSLIRRFQRWQ